MACGNNRCPRCGRIRRADGSIVTVNTGCTANGYGVATVPETTITQQLYGPQNVVSYPAVCCTDQAGSQVCSGAYRNPYWPTFARPRWLSCNQLYQRRF